MHVNWSVKQYIDSDLLLFITSIPTQKLFLSLLAYPEYVKLQSSNSLECNPTAADLLEISI